jgi:hypothetical protein
VGYLREILQSDSLLEIQFWGAYPNATTATEFANLSEKHPTLQSLYGRYIALQSEDQEASDTLLNQIIGVLTGKPQENAVAPVA